ncbi:MAG: ferritin-like domain-containing protein [Acidobacteriota bacterium]
MKEQIVKQLNHSAGRRGFAARLLGGAGLAFAAGTSVASAQTITDADIVNFALNLEYLEAEFYSVATSGKTINQFGIATSGAGTFGVTTGGGMVDLPTGGPLFTREVALQIAEDERAHVTLLRNALGSMGVTPIAKPAINMNALGIGFKDPMEFLTLARAFEDLGVTAYAGAAGLLKSKAILGVAARVFGTEAQHAANIRLQVAKLKITTVALDALDILPPPAGMKFFSLDSDALVQQRTPGQVLYLAFGNQANVSAGGFFPNGVNGAVKTSSAAAQASPCVV